MATQGLLLFSFFSCVCEHVREPKRSTYIHWYSLLSVNDCYQNCAKIIRRKRMGRLGGGRRGQTRPHPHVGSSTETVYKEAIIWLTYSISRPCFLCMSWLPLSAVFLTLINTHAFILQSTGASTLISDSFWIHTSPVTLSSLLTEQMPALLWLKLLSLGFQMLLPHSLSALF